MQTPLNRQADPVILIPQLSFGEQVALGNVSGVYVHTKFGRNSAIGTATTPEAIWNGGGDYTGHPLGSPETVEIFSDDGADVATTGTGAWTVRLWGLKTATSTEYETEDIALNGATPVASVSSWYRVPRAYVLTAGSGGENAGELTVRHTVTTANIMAVMPVETNQTQIACTTIPYANTALLKRLRISISRLSGAAGSANITLRVREPGGVFRAIRNFETTTGTTVEYTAEGGLVIPGGSDIKVVVEDVSDNSTVAEASYEFYRILD